MNERDALAKIHGMITAWLIAPIGEAMDSYELIHKIEDTVTGALNEGEQT